MKKRGRSQESKGAKNSKIGNGQEIYNHDRLFLELDSEAPKGARAKTPRRHEGGHRSSCLIARDELAQSMVFVADLKKCAKL